MKNLQQPDSLNVLTDTIATTPVVVQEPDIATQPAEEASAALSDSVAIKIQPVAKTVAPSVPKKKVEVVKEIPEENVDTLPPIVPEEYQTFVPYETLNSDDSSKVKLSPIPLSDFQSGTTNTTLTPRPRNKARVFEKEWVLGTSIFIIVLLIVVRAFYQKQLAAIITSVVNLQMADKLLREKNVMVRRVFLILNAVYSIALGIYFYQLVKRMHIRLDIRNDFHMFLFVLLLLIAVIVLRLVIARFIAFVFDAVPVFKEYIHNTLIINKNLGLYLFPVVISIFYVGQKLGDYLFIAATVMLILSVLLRYLKGIQIILKHNVFLFYSILYLCTLEILPVLIGVKFVLER